ncbi:MAG: hypothetical protein ABI977_21940 [Acidobacteriota bacterium]
MNRTEFDPRETVLIGDASQERFDLFEEILHDNFHLKALQFRTFVVLEDKIEEVGEDGGKRDWRLVIFADDLPQSAMDKQPTPERYASRLNGNVLPLVCIGSRKPRPNLPNGVRYIDVPPKPTGELSKTIVAQLDTFTTAIPPEVKLPALNYEPEDRTLREQIRSLSRERDRKDGEKIVRHLIYCFFKCTNATIEQLGQGLSGARVFLLRLEEQGRAKSFVLKLSDEDNLWKLKEEVNRHREATKHLGAKRYKVHLPSLNPCSENHSEFIAHYRNWVAVCYDYLGDDHQQSGIIDLETLLIQAPDKLNQKTGKTRFNATYLSSGQSPLEVRKNVFEEFLNWLCQEWYQKGELNQQNKAMWKPADCEPGKYPRVPPYQLKGKEKGLALGFLYGKDARKVAQLLPGWEGHRDKVWEFLEQTGETTGIAALDQPVLATLSPAHGDLNSNNAIFWLEQANHPFLIDFPFFQEEGHALQDFARLEIEIIYALMDCQEENASKLKAGDHSHTQFDLWLRLINHLTNGEDCAWQDDEISENIEHCLDLIQLLRLKAAAVRMPQGQMTSIDPAAADFLTEYLPPLLYYTLREIGYSSRPIFKRLLAVYSASQILLCLENLSSKQI